MTTRRTERKTPAELVDTWPEGPATDPAAEVVRLLAEAVRARIGGLSRRAVARQCRLDHTTIAALLEGAKWPDVATVARLEAGLGVDLWPTGAARGVGLGTAKRGGTDSDSGGAQ